MELGREDVPLPDGGRKPFAILCLRRNDRWVGRLRVETVDEIEVGAGCDVAEQWTLPTRWGDLVPTDLRDLEPQTGSAEQDRWMCSGRPAKLRGAPIIARKR